VESNIFILFIFVIKPEQQGWKSLQQLTYDSISACDPDIRKELFNSILVTGGNSLYDGFDDRLKLEITRVAPTQVCDE
jgi:actin-related protein